MYSHKKIEPKWQRWWQKQKLYATPKKLGRKKQYVLDMFPYPSGAGLHVGHPEGYTATDIYSRYLRMNGYNVLHPMGWDAFGLPAENYAIKEGIHPAKSTAANIKRFREQIKMLGLSYDWDREINTADPDYYKWTQWLFLKFYEKGLAYRKEASVNWCPEDQTVLANEQVINGHCERCGTAVVQKLLPQWFLKITDYADRLLAGLDKIDWPEPIKLMQRNWIGRSEGAEMEFGIKNQESRIKNFVLLHGFNGNPSGVFLPWVAKELRKAGFKVQIPQLPNPANPTEEEQVWHVLKNIEFDENTVLLGHSLGAVVAMKVLERLNIKIAGLVLVGGFVEHNFKDRPRPFDKTFSWKFDFSKIRKKAGFVKILSSVDDYAVPIEQGRILHEKLRGELVEIKGEKPHFTNTEEPVVLEALLPKIKIFTTRPDTIYGATYMVLAPEHPLVVSLLASTPSFSSPLEGEEGWGGIQNPKEVRKYIDEARKKTELQRTALEKDKTGVELKGIKAINPATKEEIPVWIADYVLMGYGTGAIMAVPAHDERDFVFAKKYKLPIRKVIIPPEIVSEPVQPPSPGAWGHLDADLEADVWIGDGKLVNSGKFNGQDSEKAKWKITALVNGVKKVQYKLRDWLISRQRYWGAPIPIVYCEDCGIQPVPEKDLPVKLPTDVDFRPTGESPLARSKSFHEVKCPNCGKAARRDTDTMDTFVDSSWYYLRFTDPHNKKEFASKKETSKWCPVDVYVGGAEHAVLHLMYARFFWKALADMKLVNGSTADEPFLKLRNQGLILGPDGQKMSKSRGNVINPDDVVDEYGADSMRMFEMFMGPLEDAKPWSTQGIKGVRRFLEKGWRLFSDVIPAQAGIQTGSRIKSGMTETQRLLHKTIKKVGEDIKSFKFNTAVSAMMILVNEMTLRQAQGINKKDWETFLKLLAPFAPHMAEELWQKLGHKKSVHLEPWPQYDEKLVEEEEVNIVVQVNGKVRATFKASRSASQVDIEKLAKADENVAKYLEGKVRKVIFVPGKVINFVI
ncbi:MAG: leucine--tRNA ligase [Candidatus Doudnabacteria bacterium]|nr:leucine--tRNA ligase [Candidatus Doudnabacteria bacterium]